MDDNFIKLLLTVHKDLPQEGPGSKESTLKALSLIKSLPKKPKILDIGCGPGRQTMDLAGATDGKITAIDIFEQYLEQLRKKVKELKLNKRIDVVNCSMEKLNFSPKSFDLIWSEGAIYLMGFEKGLNYWKDFLKPGGYIAVTECSWLKDNPPDEIKQYFDEGYPGMQTVDNNIEIIKRAGHELIGHFTLPKSDWYQYYKPLKARIAKLKQQDDPELSEYLKTEEVEFDLYDKYHEYYGYEFFVMKLE
jgi:ubiquinone/menaquinone biosynthesis C-methylase UbiE